MVAADMAAQGTPAATGAHFDPLSVVFSDAFESGTLANWTDVHGLVVQGQEVYSGRYAARATSTGGAAYARASLNPPRGNLFVRVRFKILRRNAGVYLLELLTAANTSVLALYMTDQGKLGYRNDVAGQDARSATVVSSARWHEIQVHVQFAGIGGQVAVWYDGAPIKALTQTEALGTTPIGRVQIGASVTGDSFDVAFDDIVAATQFIPPTFGMETPASATSATANTNADGTTNAAETNATTNTTAPGTTPRPVGTACPAGQSVCGGACVNTAADPANCGGCGIACGFGETCLSGACGIAATGCANGETACQGACVNLGSDPANCGGCGVACAPGQSCAGGTCAAGPGGACPGGCGQGQACCDGACTDLGNEANCGACGDACGQGQVCCSGAAGCVDPSSDPNNCGTCGTVCAQGQGCANGTCTGGASCPAGEADCGNGCIDLGTEANCGGCGVTCGAGQVCLDQTCQSPGCPAGQAYCGNGCVSLGDEMNCSACGDACGAGQVCLSGACTQGAATCAAGQADCGNGCVNLGDEVNCSACGDACGQGQVCCNQSCQASC